MTVQEAVSKVPEKNRIPVGDLDFAPLKWQHPDNPNSNEKGPILVSIYGDIAIEVSASGQFVQVLHLKTDGYSPFFEKSTKKRNEQIKTLIKDLTDRLA